MKTKTLLLVALLMSAAIVNAKVWRVNPNITYDADFHTLQEAVDTAWVTDGDTIYCEAGYYPASETTITKRLVIIGTGFGATDVIASEFKGTLILKQDSITIKGIKAHCIQSDYSSWKGNYCTIERCSATGGMLLKDYCIIKNCIVGTGAGAFKIGNNAIITGNIIYYSLDIGNGCYITNNTFGVMGVGTQNSQIKDNIILGSSSFSNCAGCIITHNILSMTTPVEGFENNYYVGATCKGLFGKDSPAMDNPIEWRIVETDEFNAKTSSSTGGECGAFGGAEPFRIGMRPFGIPYIYDVAIPSTVVGDQLNINFKVGIQNE